jgi:hypothetical protein
VHEKIVGTQNNSGRSALLLSLLALKKRKKSKIAIIQNHGETRLSSNPPARAATPVAFSGLKVRNIDQSARVNSARKTAPKTDSAIFKDFIVACSKL